MSHQKDTVCFHRFMTPCVLFLISFSLYLKTSSLDIYWKDAGELTVAVTNLGICHPSGYPVYSLLGFLAGWLPWADVSARITLISVIFGALCVPLLYLSLRRICVDPWFSCSGALIIMLSHEIWFQSVVTEIYSFSLFLFILIFLLLNTRSTRQRLLGFFILGVSLAHHLTTLLLVPAFLSLLLKNKRPPDRKIISMGLLLIVLGMSSLIYLPVRSATDPPADFGDPQTAEKFLDHYLTRHYKSKMFPDTLEPVLNRIGIVFRLLVKQSSIAGSVLGLLAVFGGILSSRYRIFVSLFLCANISFLLYPPDHSFLIPFITLTGCSLIYSLDRCVKHIRASGHNFPPGYTIKAIAYALAGTMFLQNYVFLDKSDHRYARWYGRQLLANLENQSFLLTNGDNAYSLVRYLQINERFRDDVTHIHRPGLTWPGELEILRRKFPDWHPQLDLVSTGDRIDLHHSEAADPKETVRYIAILAGLTEFLGQEKVVFWESGSDLMFFYPRFIPQGVVFSQSNLPIDPGQNARFWTGILDLLIPSKSFLLDHNAVSEVSVNLFNLASYYDLRKQPEMSLWCARLAALLWKSQLDPEPHNELVEGMSAAITQQDP